MKSDNSARRVAFDVLQAVHVDDAYSNLILPALLDQRKIDSRDSGLATELTYGTLRRQGSLDAVIDACASRTESMDLAVRDVLRLGAYQILFMRIPAHAAVSETVTLARDVHGVGSSKFVNAVLRKISTRTLSEWFTELSRGLAKDDALALEFSYPVWVIRALSGAYKADDESLSNILEAGNEPAPVSLVARPGQATIDELLDLPHIAPGQWSPLAGTMVRPVGEQSWSTRPGDIADVQTNRIGVQDEGSQLVAIAVARVPVEGTEHAWLDMCAGPGGKAAILAGFAAQVGASFTALEPIEPRAHLVENSLANAPGDHAVVVTDAREYEPGILFDRILIDAPCTGLGALRRRPEARWRRQPSDVPVLSLLQSQLLAHGATLVRPGGVIGYATCSPHLAETDAVVNDFLRKHVDFELIPVSPVLPQVPHIGDTMRLRPDIHHTDGMFLALLRRKTSH